MSNILTNFHGKEDDVHLKKMKIFFKITFAFILFSSCRENSPEQNKNHIGRDPIPEKTKIKQDDSIVDETKIVIIKFDASDYKFKYAKTTTLSEKEMNLAETLLFKCIQVNNASQDSTKHILQYINIDNYKRQYIPFANAKGEKLVWINCFCKNYSSFNTWKTEIVEMDDGGACFFNVMINLSTKKNERLFINGL